MNLFDIFKDEKLIEILESGELSIDHDVEKEGDTRIYFTPTEQNEISKILLETLLDTFKDYDITLLIGSNNDKSYFTISNYETLQIEPKG